MQERIVNVRDGIYDAWKNATPRNVACKTTQFLAEAYLQHKLATALTEFFSNAEQYADQLRRGISSLEKEEYLAQTPEGTKVSVKGQYVEAADEAALETETQLHRRAHGEYDGATINDTVNQTSQAVFKNGYYEVNGFRFTRYYYQRLWDKGRGAPSLIAQEILDNVIHVVPDPKGFQGFFKYISCEWEMVYNPQTKIVSHIQPIKPIRQ